MLELLDVPDLKERQQQAGPFSEAATTRVVRAVLRALEYLHARDIVHRDLKPPNLMLPRGVPVCLCGQHW